MSDKDQLEHGESSLSGKPGPEKSASVTGGTVLAVLFALSCAGLWGAINKPPSASRAASTTLIAVMGLSLLVGWVVLLLIACNVISQMP